MARMKYERVEAEALKFGKAVVSKSRKNLTGERANASKTLWNSIGFRFKDMTMVFFMERYGAFLDKGVSGTGKLWLTKTNFMPVAYNKSDADFKFSPSKKAIGGSLKRWLQIRHIPLSAEFPIRRSIHAKGIRPRRFFTYAFDAEVEKFNESLGKAVTLDLEEQIDNILK